MILLQLYNMLPINHCRRQCSLNLVKYLIGLLSDSYEGGSATELLQFLGTNISACGAQSPEDVLDGVGHVPPVLHLHRLALRGPGRDDIIQGQTEIWGDLLYGI